jgi:predicted nucleic acid-binding protein
LIVVADTSPILNLARIGRLSLLGSLYGQVLVPPAVLEELRIKQESEPAIDIASIPWLTAAAPIDQGRVHELQAHLDSGEAEAIVLALERHADLLIVDERRGRRIAAAAGLQITGLLGVLAEAKISGALSSVKPVLDDLIRDAHFWIGQELYTAVLTELGEA